MASPNLLIQEQSLRIHYNVDADLFDYLVDPAPISMTGGHIELMTGPGLGVEVDEAAVRDAARRGHRWRTPTWRHPDGALAEW